MSTEITMPRLELLNEDLHDMADEIGFFGYSPSPEDLLIEREETREAIELEWLMAWPEAVRH